MSTRIGQQLGNYTLLRLLGQGGFAEVYLGQHVHLDTLAAIKVLPMRLVGNSLEVFRNEARTLASMTHPNIVRILDFGVLDDIPFLVMDYAPNGTLRDRIPEGTSVALPTIVSYVKQVAAALQYAHDRKLIHRDVKPANMLLGSTNNVLLSDFGLVTVAHSSRSQETQEVSGTLAYAAPEQLRGKSQVLSDQYALGIVVYEWLCGERPFQGSFIEILGQHITTAPPPLRGRGPAISAEVEAVVIRALQKEPHLRFPRVEDFANALERAASQRTSDIIKPANLPRLLPSKPQTSQPTRITAAPDTTQPVPQTNFVPSPLPQPVPIDQLATAPEILPQPKSTIQLPSVPTTGLQTPFQTPPTNPLSPMPPALPAHNPTGAFSLRAHNPTGTFSLPAHTPTGALSSIEPGITRGLLASKPAQATTGTVDISAPKTTQDTRKRLSRRALLGLGVAGLVVVGGGVALGTTLLLRNDRPPQGAKLVTYTGHTDNVWTVAWSPDGKYVASGGNDGSVHVWDAMTGNRVYIYAGHLHANPNQAATTITAIAWSSDSKRIASCGSYQLNTGTGQFLPTVQVWEALTGRPIVASYDGHMPKNLTHSNRVDDISWSPDGKRIVSAGAFDNTAKIWEAQTGTTLLSYDHATPVDRSQWSPDGKYIATHSGAGVIVWDTGGNQITTYYNQTTFAWSPDGKRLVTSGDDNNLRFFDMTTKTAISTDQLASSYSTLTWSPNGDQLAGTTQIGSKRGAIELLDTNSRTVVYTYNGFGKQVNAFSWSPDSSRIVVGGLDTVVFIWQAA